MIQKICIALSVLLAFTLQCSIFTNLHLAGVVPNLLIILISTYGVMHGEYTGMFVGFFGGLMMDVFFGGILGFYALLFTLIGFLNGQFCGLYFPEDIRMPMLLILSSDLTYGVLFYAFRFLLRGRTHFPFYFLHVILPETLYTLLIALILYPLMARIYMAFERKRIEKEQNLTGGGPI